MSVAPFSGRKQVERVVRLEVVRGAAAAFAGLGFSLFQPSPASPSQKDVSGGAS